MRLFLLFLLFSATAWGGDYGPRKINFKYSGLEVLYRCSTVEGIAIDHLATLGAQNVNAHCKGGAEVLAPIQLTINFDVPIPHANGRREVKILKPKDPQVPHCGINVRLIDRLLPEFPSIKTLEKRTNCSNHLTPWSYTLRVME